MIQNKVISEGSVILSQKELSAYFQTDKFNRNSFTQSDSNQTSPNQLSPKNNDSDSENDTTTQNHEEELQRLNSIITLQRNRNQSLNHEIQTLTNSLHIETTLTNELQLAKQKLIEELHYIKKSYESVQNDKNRYYNEAISLRNENNKMRGILQINEEQINTLENTNRNVIDELNFEKEMCADYKIENNMFKAQLKNTEEALIRVKEWIEEEKERIVKEVNEILGGQAETIRDGLAKLREEIKGAGAEQKELVQHKNEIFGIVRKMELSFESTRTQLNIAQSLSQSFEEPSTSVFLVRQSEFRKTIESQQQTIKSLTSELTSLKSQIHILQDELEESSHIQLLAPRFHTNTGYVNKLVKENHREIMEIKEILDSKEEEMDRMREQLKLEKSTSMLKTEEIERLNIILKMEQNNKYEQFSNEIEDLKAEKVRLNRRVDQLNEKIGALKNQNLEKDRIIINYVNKNKAQ